MVKVYSLIKGYWSLWGAALAAAMDVKLGLLALLGLLSALLLPAVFKPDFEADDGEGGGWG